MYNEDKINDSLEFVEQIKLYETIDPLRLSEFNNDNSFSREIYNYDINIKSDNKIVYDDYTEKNVSTFRAIAGDIIYVIVCILLSFIIAFVTTRYIAHHTTVDGNSMKNTLTDGDCLIINKVSYALHEPERFDIVVFEYSEHVNYIKRIIGLPGEVVQIIDGYVYVNGTRLSDDIYGKEMINNPGIASEPIRVGKNQYFVLGDNRNSSSDSRSTSVGMIDLTKIEGKAVFRIYPFSTIGIIK